MEELILLLDFFLVFFLVLEYFSNNNYAGGVTYKLPIAQKPDTDISTPVIWLGDSSFLNVDSDGNSAFDGDTTLRSTLNVGRHYNFDTSSIVAGYMTLYHSATRKLELTSEDDASGHVQFNFNALTDN